MKKLLALFCLLIFLVACNNDDKPDNLIAEDKMANVLTDMHLSDAALDVRFNQDSLLIFAKDRYNYVFKKHKIDSAKFSTSLKYYGKNTEQMKEIYEVVEDSLLRMQDNINKEQLRTLRLPLKFIDSLNKTIISSSLIYKLKKDSVAKTVDLNKGIIRKEIKEIQRQTQDSLRVRKTPIK
ncbi:DUF4296 domain-containing protein [Pedobacter glucosidilyticus]|uniref:DUF4296 domain-containing protein n=1 Tax=Pedobacter glucosidilyticus TaxID=1122941 RepID=UPI00041B5BA3|nr:DUF4296 domain-containing protein [Pedobacter glucosidilyticus]